MGIAILFPGQGSQEQSMGREIAENFSQAMDLWKKAEQISNLPLREIYWESGDDALMADTKSLQIALTVTNLSAWQVLAPKLNPSAVAGHSLGEFSAYVAAKVLDVDSVLNIVNIRGKLMAEADPDKIGAMAAVLKANEQTVKDAVEQIAKQTGETIIVANYNTPGQFVISGTKAAINEITPLLKELKARALPLAVSGAFHSPLMAKASAELNKYLSKLTWNKPQFPIYSNVTGTAITDGESLKELAQKQMTSSVLWINTIASQYNDGIRTWIEISPKAVVSKMVKPILDDKGLSDEISSSCLSKLDELANYE